MKKRISLLQFVLVILLGGCGVERVEGQVPPTRMTFLNGKDRAEIPFRRYRKWIVIDGKVNGTKTISFILDTGAPIAVIGQADTAEPLNLNMVGSIQVSGVDGKEPRTVPLANEVKFTFGDIEIESGLVAVGITGEVISGVDAVIGRYMFENAVVQIDWVESKLTLYKPDSFSYQGDGVTIPFKHASTGHIYTEIAVEANGKEAMTKAIIDTGNRSGFDVGKEVGSAILDGSPMLEDIIVAWGANGSVNGDVSRTSIRMGQIEIPNIITSIRNIDVSADRLSQEGISGNIGLHILERYNLIFDYAKGILIMEKNDLQVEEFTFNRSGILADPKRQENHVRVAGIIPNSPASESGMKKEDMIVVVNGMSVQKQDLDDVLRGNSGNRLEVEVMRNGSRLKFTLALRDLI